MFIQRTPAGTSFCTGHTETSHPARILLNRVPNLSSSCSTPPLTWTPASETLTGIRPTTSATSPSGGHSDPLADPTPNTGYEPNLCIDVSSEHTPISYPFRKNNCSLEEFRRFSSTISSSTWLSSFACTGKSVRGNDSVASSLSGTRKRVRANDSVAS